MELRKSYLVFFATVILMIAQMPASAQNYTTRSNRALKAYLEGKRAYDFYDYRSAEIMLKDAIATDAQFIEAHILLAEMYYDTRRFAESAASYRRAVTINSSFFVNSYYFMGDGEFRSGQYELALESYRLFLATNPKSDKLKADSYLAIQNCLFAIEAIKNPVPFNPVNLGPAINTGYNEYSPAITADGNTLMFTRELETGGNDPFMGRRQEDFYISYRDEEGNWSNAVNAGKPLNTSGNEGAHTLGAGGQYMYFTACDRPGGLGRCDIYFSAFDGERWSEPFNLGEPVNTAYWETQPSISADGKSLYFVSSKPGGFGGSDIWVSEMGADGKWGEPVNAGDVINTAGDETTPFIHFDGKTLYFSSNGRPNLGGYDIYMSRLQKDDTWSTPENLGFPVNTHNDEVGLVIESNGYRAYFSSTRNEANKKDIFWFELYEAARPEKVSYLKGVVYDFETRRRLTAKYELINLSTGENVASGLTSRDGQFLVCLPSGFDYGLNVSSEGFLFYSDNFPFGEGYSEFRPLQMDILLNRIKPGETLVLNNLLFNISSSELLKGSFPELDKLYQLMAGNPELKVEIGGHTDDTGSDEFNQRLSEARALSVVKYLTGRGIPESQLVYKGYGKSSPVKDNSTSEGRRLNRRTEVKILEIKIPD
jgi:outer membrane protein OmpA-like peptidoglycan-associated protein